MNSSLPPDEPAAPQPPPQGYRFGLASMFLITGGLSATFAGAYYLVRAVRGAQSERATAVLFTVLAPVLLIVLGNAARAAFLFFRGRSRKKNRTRHYKG